jgi:hypothetical protein
MWPLDNISGLRKSVVLPRQQGLHGCLPSARTSTDSRSLLLPPKGRSTEHENGFSSSNVRAVDGNRLLIPRATTDELCLFIPKGARKWMDHYTTCVGLQEGRHGVEELLSTVGPMQNYDVHYHHARARGPPP